MYRIFAGDLQEAAGTIPSWMTNPIAEVEVTSLGFVLEQSPFKEDLLTDRGCTWLVEREVWYRPFFLRSEWSNTCRASAKK